MSLTNASYRYLLAVCATQEEDPKATKALSDQSKVVYDWIQNYYFKYDNYPTPRQVSDKFNLQIKHDTRHGLSELVDDLVDQRIRHNTSAAILNLQNKLLDKDLDTTSIQQILDECAEGLTFTNRKDIISSRDYKRVIRERMEMVREGGILHYGFPSLDYYTGGIKPAQYILVYAPTNVGKSVFTRKVAVNNVEAGNVVLYITLENTAEETLLSCLSLLFGTNPDDLFEKTSLTNNVKQAIRATDNMLRKGSGELVVCGSLFTKSIKEIQQLADTYQPDLIILDQMSHFLPDGRDLVDRFARQSEAVSSFTRKTRIPIIVNAQAKRGSSGETDDVNWSQRLIQDARMAFYIGDIPKDPDDMIEGNLKRLKIVKADHKDKGIEILQIWNRNNSMVREIHEGDRSASDMFKNI